MGAMEDMDIKIISLTDKTIQVKRNMYTTQGMNGQSISIENAI